MCGRLNVTDNPAMQALCEQLGIRLWPETPVRGRFLHPAQKVSIVCEQEGIRQMVNAIWWLLLEIGHDGCKVSKYTSFNTRSDKLNVKGSAGYQAFRHSRCVVPITGFGETLSVPGQAPRYTDLTAKDGVLLLGGICRRWQHSMLSMPLLSFSVITLPPHPKLRHIHSQSMPLILPREPDLITYWLSEKVTQVDDFAPLLIPHLPVDLVAQPIDRPSRYHPIDAPYIIERDPSRATMLTPSSTPSLG